MEKYEDYLKNRTYELSKIEIIQNTPEVKKIEGVTITLNEHEYTIVLDFPKRSTMLAIDIVMFEIGDPALDIVKIFINGHDIDYTKEMTLVVESILALSNDTNTLTIQLLNKESIYYEFGCIFYKVFKNKKENWHLNILLDEYGIKL